MTPNNTTQNHVKEYRRLTFKDVKVNNIFKDTDDNYYIITKVYKDRTFKYKQIIPTDRIISEDVPTDTLSLHVDDDYIITPYEYKDTSFKV